MQRAFVAAAILVGLLSGCHRGIAPLESRVGMADANAAHQLISGFYPLEGNAWRWTARQFCVTFPGPPQKRDRILTLHLFVPEVQIQKLGAMTLSADVNGTILEPQTYRQPGMQSYVRHVPGEALESNIIPVVFFLDKSVPAGPGEPRELGVVVNDVQLADN